MNISKKVVKFIAVVLMMISVNAFADHTGPCMITLRTNNFTIINANLIRYMQYRTQDDKQWVYIGMPNTYFDIPVANAEEAQRVEAKVVSLINDCKSR